MYPLNEPDVQRIRRQELMREVENARLARRLRDERAAGVRSISLGRAMSALRAALVGKPRVGDC